MASIEVEAAASSASSVDLRIGCSGRNWKFRLDMHSISVGYRVAAPQDETHDSVRERPTATKTEKFSDRAPRRSGISARLAQNDVCDRDNHVRKSRGQCTDPDAGHSRDDRGRGEGAHRDADTPKAIGITLIETVRDQHRSQP